ncbi:unnamed protein product [Peniophora sp. CBMAI 1063]|nr:unnamed protein product [Peniophora sp. CBMAI 1063]
MRALEMDLDIDYASPSVTAQELDVKCYVVLRGYTHGVMDKLNAILATAAISGSLVVKMRDENAAQQRWREALIAGNQVAVLGTSSAEEARSIAIFLSQI